MWAFLFGPFAKWFLGITVILVLLITLVSLVGGFTYDTGYHDNWEWSFTINFHFGETMEKIRNRVDEFWEKREENMRPLLEPPFGRRFFRERRPFFEPRPVEQSPELP